MPNKQARVFFKIKDWNNLNDSKRSLINFIMKNGSMYFYGTYDNGNLVRMSGCLRLNSRVIPETVDGNDICYDVMASYTDQSDVKDNQFKPTAAQKNNLTLFKCNYTEDESESWHSHSISDISSNSKKSIYYNGIVEHNTVLCETRYASLQLYKTSDYYPFHNNAIKAPVVSEMTGTNSKKLNISMRISTIFDGESIPNENKDVLPLDIANKSNEYSLLQTSIDLSSAANNPIAYQLRTDWFKLNDDNLYFYKIGIVPFGNTTPDTSDGIKDLLKESHDICLLLSNVGEDDSATYGCRFLLKYNPETAIHYIVNESGDGSKPCCITRHVQSQNGAGLASAFILPLIRNNDCKGLIYFRLFKATGTEGEASEECDGLDSLAINSLYDLNSITGVSSLRLSISDTDLDGKVYQSIGPAHPEWDPVENYTVIFTNNTYSNLPITLPESRTVAAGTVITLPSIEGEYENEEGTYIYTPQAWVIGDNTVSFGEDITVNENINANLKLSARRKTYTVTFTCNDCEDLPFSLPEAQTVESGEYTTLPLVSVYDGDDAIYTPSAWSINGSTYSFGEQIRVDEDINADLSLSLTHKYTLSFVNNDYPAFDEYITLPSSIKEVAGTSVTLPPVTTDYTLEDANYIYTPSEWSLNGTAVPFNGSITLDDTVTAYLVWLVAPKVIVTLPTVSIENNFGDSNWIVNGTSGQSVTIAAGQTRSNFYVAGSSSITPHYNTSKSYAALYRNETNGGTYVDPTMIRFIDGNPTFIVKNESESDITVYGIRVAVCSSSDTEIVTVYDDMNNKHNAFKYTISGTDNYYVLDGIQTDWGTDLSSIGYSLTANPLGTLAFTTPTFPIDTDESSIQSMYNVDIVGGEDGPYITHGVRDYHNIEYNDIQQNFYTLYNKFNLP